AILGAPPIWMSMTSSHRCITNKMYLCDESEVLSFLGFPERSGKGSFGRRAKREVSPGKPRTEKMPLDQDWTSVYPAATPFRANSVPLPVRMGYPVRGGVPPEKKGNLELIKIPNFLHLTPAAIRKHCEALKPFCTEWPSALDSGDKCDELFPVKIESSDFVSAGPSVRNPAARVVHLRVSDVIRPNIKYESFIDELPSTLGRAQSSVRLVTFSVVQKIETWEAEKTRADMEEYIWEDSPSQKNLLDTLLRAKVAGAGGGEEVREQLLERREVQEYKDSVVRLKNEENESSLTQYKEAVRKVLNL
uniref:Mitochondrial ribosomal protein S35 n=1 Tax=Nothobranchius furzeri TaxID=105023 RepID=A0A8C6PCS0_NOTFU